MNFEHVTSSPNYARSNGFSERSVQTVKNSLIKMLSDGKTLAVTLIALRSTPVGNGLPSPAVLLQGRNLRSGLHCHTESAESRESSTGETLSVGQAESVYVLS